MVQLFDYCNDLNTAKIGGRTYIPMTIKKTEAVGSSPGQMGFEPCGPVSPEAETGGCLEIRGLGEPVQHSKIPFLKNNNYKQKYKHYKQTNSTKSL